MIDERLPFSDFRDVLFDQFGNRREVHMIARYQKSSSGEWRETERFTTDAGSTFVVNGKIYFLCGDQLLPVNMDFNSPTCGACEKIIGDVKILRTITKNEFLGYSSDLSLCLHKQYYSDGTSFYTVQDSSGNFFPRHGNRDPKALADTLRQDAEPKNGRPAYDAETLLYFASILDKAI